MILIVDSGSTKSDWVAVDSKGNQLLEKVRTKGLNPAILSSKKLKKIIKKNKDLKALRNNVSHVFFYGAGCGTESPKTTLKTILNEYFINAEVEVNEDTMAAVYSTLNCKTEAAIVCILGTGSNCSYFDGEKLHQRVASLGYTIMDDASGNFFGKQLIRDYYFKTMPKAIRVAFNNSYDMDADIIKYNLYKQPNPNAYLASFAKFMFLNKDSEYIKGLIKNGVRLFIKNMIMQYNEELKTVPIHFAGSIAFFAKEEIIEIAKEFKLRIGNFQQRPIEGLVSYHIKNLK